LYTQRRSSGTILCYYQHKVNADPYNAIGEQDITSHVNFSALCHWGFKNNLICCGLTNQGSFLLGLGFKEHLRKILENGDEATTEFQKIGLLNKEAVKNEDKENRAYKKYLYHGISHHLGIDVHDLGTRTEPIQPGMVFTVEPGIYIEEEQMGVRIENNFWITKTGNKDLMKNIPITAEDIERLMKK
jgi:hypothetical protein